MTTNLQTFMSQICDLVEIELSQCINDMDTPTRLKEAMDYSLQAGGKRIRPILLCATLQALSGDFRKGISTAIALEMIHTYSLIHDDLPAMDDDDLRRGKPTNHKVYGEATAILAGDGLLTYSFRVIANDANLDADMKVKLLSLLADSAGPEGMVAGQIADMEAENCNLSIEQLEQIHANKTGKLLLFSVIAGAMIGKATKEQLSHFEEYAKHLGIAFQIRDDILDVEGEQSVIGKPVGSDNSNHKSTYPAILTLDGAKERLRIHIEKATDALSKTNTDMHLLLGITELIADRNH